MNTNTINENFLRVESEIHDATLASGRPLDSVKLVAVSKMVSEDQILEAVQAGATDLGENYVQESREKIETLREEPITWHFIGHLQTNKAKYVVKLFNLIHSVDSLKLARELDKRARAIDKIQNILIQVNISEEKTKSGVTFEKAMELVQQASQLPNLRVEGLMTMPPYFNAPDKVRPYFKGLKHLADHIEKENIPNVHMKELSMGMTGDFKTAIEEGATLVRIGTAIFGTR